MTTLYINGKFSAQSVTGVQRAAIELVRALDRVLAMDDDVHRVRCVLLCPPGATPPVLEHIEVRFVGAAGRNLQWWEQVRLSWAARDGVLLNLSGSAPWLSARKSVCLLHDAAVFDHPNTYTLTFRLWYRTLFRHLGKHALALITISSFARDRLCKALNVPIERFRIVQHGSDHFQRVAADNSVMASYGLTPNRFILVVGTAKQTKNVAAVLSAWRALRPDPASVLVWVGGTNHLVFSEPDSSQAEVETDESQGIFRIGYISDSRLKALYENAAGLMLPSYYEGFGLPAIEAMVCGCPVAAASAASLPEVCANAAYFFDPARLDDMGKVMDGLLNDGRLRERLRLRGRERALDFTWDKAARNLMSQLNEAGVYRKVATENNTMHEVPSTSA